VPILRSPIWSRVFGLKRLGDGVCINFVKSRKRAKDTLTMIRQARAVHECSIKSLNLPRPKKAGQVKSRVKSLLIILFDIERMFTKDSP
jgi:hypothetical protein